MTLYIDTVEKLLVLMIIVFWIGAELGRYLERKKWELQPNYDTPLRSGGIFFYVMTEKNYNHYLQKLRKQALEGEVE